MRSRLRQCALIALCLLVVWIWWERRIEAPVRAPLVTAEAYDDYAYYYPMFRYGFEQLRHGEFPFWNPYQHCGSPFFATAQHLLLYPLNTLFLLLPVPAAMKGTAILHIALAILFTVALGRSHGMSTPAALAAGLLFGFSPGLTNLLCNPQHLYGAVWIPLALALTRRLLTQARKAAPAVLLGCALAAQYLGGYPMFCVFAVHAVGAYVLWYVATEWRALTRQSLIANAVALAAAGGLALCLVLPQALPAIELAQLSPRAVGGLTVETADAYLPGWRIPVYYAAAALLPSIDAQVCGSQIAHVGVIGLALAGAALLLGRRSASVWFFAVLSAVTALLALGRHTPLYGWYFHVPAANWFRLPIRFFLVTSLGLAMLGGFGVDVLLREAVARRRLIIAACVTGALALAVAVLHLADPGLTARLVDPLGKNLDARLAALVAYLLGLTLWMTAYAYWRRARPVLVGGLVAAAYASLFFSFVNYSPLPETDPDVHVMAPDAVAFLHEHQGYDRTFITSWATMMPAAMLPPRNDAHQSRPHPIPAKAGMLHHLYVVGDRENVYPVRITDYAARTLDPVQVEHLRSALAEHGVEMEKTLPQGDLPVGADSINLQLLDLLGVRFIVEGPGSNFSQPAAAARFPLIYDRGGVHIYDNPAARPRAYLVGEIEVVTDPARVLDRLTSPDFDPLKTAVLEEEPAWRPQAAGAPGEVKIVEYAPHRVVLEATTPAPAFLVLTDQFYPGWRAEVDGDPTPIYRADYLFRAVALVPGHHRVVFRFVPTRFYLGCLIGAAGILVGVAIFLVARSRTVAGAATRGAPPPAASASGRAYTEGAAAGRWSLRR